MVITIGAGIAPIKFPGAIRGPAGQSETRRGIIMMMRLKVQPQTGARHRAGPGGAPAARAASESSATAGPGGASCPLLRPARAPPRCDAGPQLLGRAQPAGAAPSSCLPVARHRDGHGTDSE